MPHGTRAPKQCIECEQMFAPNPIGAVPIRCPDCRPAAKRKWKRDAYRRSNIAVAVDNSRPCKTCGGPVYRNGKVYAYYCSDDCKPRCSVDGCENPSWKKTWCGAHYSQWRRIGEVRPFKYKWTDDHHCIVCGKDTSEIVGLRRYCSFSCAQYWYDHNGNPPKEARCVHCFKAIPLGLVEGKTRRQRVDIKMCRRCKTGLRKYGMSVDQLAARDGAVCKLCDQPVDMTLRAPDPGCPSVDHKFPRAHGGTNDPSNLQLAHLICNVLKHDKLIEEIAA